MRLITQRTKQISKMHSGPLLSHFSDLLPYKIYKRIVSLIYFEEDGNHLNFAQRKKAAKI